MNLNALIYLFIFSIFATLLMWLFNANAFHECVNPAQIYVATSLLPILAENECLLVMASLIFLILILPALIVGYIFHLIASLLGYTKRIAVYAMWTVWVGSFYYCAFLLTFLTYSVPVPT